MTARVYSSLTAALGHIAWRRQGALRASKGSRLLETKELVALDSEISPQGIIIPEIVLS